MPKKSLNDFKKSPQTQSPNSSQQVNNNYTGNKPPKMRHRDRQESKGGNSRASRQSGNHLLNFKFSPRSSELHECPSPRRKKVQNHGIISREQYLQANFRFVLYPGVNEFHNCFYDPDTLADWNSVESINVRIQLNSEIETEGSISDVLTEAGWKCPICLEVPLCPRLSRCGHGPFCYTCILRHLDHEYGKRCPMCFDHISRDRLARAVLKIDLKPVENRPVTFSLLYRYKGQLTHSNKPYSRSNLFLLEDDPLSRFSRLSIANPQYLRERLINELNDLATFRFQITESGDTEWLPFISEAHDALEMARVKLESVSHCENHEPPRVDIKPMKVNQSSPEYEQFQCYEMEDGQYSFLHPLNMRCLLKEYSNNGESSLPDSFSARVLEVETFRLSYEIRRRYGFLGHLPEHCDVSFIEVDLSDYISNETRNHFKYDLDRRSKKRNLAVQKAAEEKEKEEHEKEMILAMRFATLDLHGPLPGYSNADDADEESEEVQIQSAENQSDSAISFAKIISKSQEIKDDFPTLGSSVWREKINTNNSWENDSHILRTAREKKENNSKGKKGKGQSLFSNAGNRRHN